MRAVTMMSNSTCIAELYSRIDHKFDLMCVYIRIYLYTIIDLYIRDASATAAPSSTRASTKFDLMCVYSIMYLYTLVVEEEVVVAVVVK